MTQSGHKVPNIGVGLGCKLISSPQQSNEPTEASLAVRGESRFAQIDFRVRFTVAALLVCSGGFQNLLAASGPINWLDRTDSSNLNFRYLELEFQISRIWISLDHENLMALICETHNRAAQHGVSFDHPS
jgi:hypothetical protein